jgi:hypothetical protein
MTGRQDDRQRILDEYMIDNDGSIGCPFLLLHILGFYRRDVFPSFRRLMKLLILLTIQNVFCDALFCDAAIVCNCTVFPLPGD